MGPRLAGRARTSCENLLQPALLMTDLLTGLPACHSEAKLKVRRDGVAFVLMRQPLQPDQLAKPVLLAHSNRHKNDGKQ